MDQEQIRKMVEVDGLSLSHVSRLLNKSVGSISSFCKRHGIIGKHKPSKERILPIKDIYTRYISGISLYALTQEYNIPAALLRKKLLKFDSLIIFRTPSEATRPSMLNDRDMLLLESQKKSYRKIAAELGVKVSTVTKAARRLGIFINRKRPVNEDLICELHVGGRSINQICELTKNSFGVIRKIFIKNGWEVRKPGGIERQSSIKQLNDKEWLYEQYKVRLRGMADIADEISTSVGNVKHHLVKHGIILRTKEEYLSILVSLSHGVRQTVNDLKLDSKLEVKFVKCLGDRKITQRNATFESRGSRCFIDFLIDGRYVDVKSKERSEVPGPDRRRLIKQWMICKNNGVDLKVWNGGSFDNLMSVELKDLDTYYCSNWKLHFETADKCSDWLINFGFQGVEYPIGELVDALRSIHRVKPGFELNANYQNAELLKLIKHFSQHYWHSHHDQYMPIAAAWEPGNRVVLRNAVERLWEHKIEVNLYGLVKFIGKYYKDFSPVSIFKPWIAEYIYRKYIPNGGVVVDPCMGWGGRLIGCCDQEITYLGNDFNPNAVSSHGKLRKFLSYKIKDASFTNLDASIYDPPCGDLLLTSPPYDSTEHYFGLQPTKNLLLIIENIMFKFKGIIVLNIPRRSEGVCIEITKRCGREILEKLDMRTESFMGRIATSEPILVFKAK